MSTNTQTAQTTASKVLPSIVAEAADLRQSTKGRLASPVMKRFAKGSSRELDVGQRDARPLRDQPSDPPGSSLCRA
jgi:hypothetical protein